MTEQRFPTAPRQEGPQVRTWRMIQNVSGPLEGTLNDWPSHIQDTIAHAIDKLKEKHKLPLLVTQSECGHDVDTGYYVFVVVQYIPNLLVLH